MDALEQSLIQYLAGLGIQSEPGSAGLTGVWSAGKKVAAIGIKLSRSIVSHGFALNLTTNLDYFGGIVPCGHADKEATSVKSLSGRSIETQEAAQVYGRHFSEVFGVEVTWVAADRVLARPVA